MTGETKARIHAELETEATDLRGKIKQMEDGIEPTRRELARLQQQHGFVTATLADFDNFVAVQQ